jgi:hypothetical protein
MNNAITHIYSYWYIWMPVQWVFSFAVTNGYFHGRWPNLWEPVEDRAHSAVIALLHCPIPLIGPIQAVFISGFLRYGFKL